MLGPLWGTESRSGPQHLLAAPSEGPREAGAACRENSFHWSLQADRGPSWQGDTRCRDISREATTEPRDPPSLEP